jgi:SAM-dependent methyltransferase
MAATDWRTFWDSANSIYVNARHKDVHYRQIAEQIAAFVPGPSARVLDFGCGDALHADLVAAVAAEVMLSDAAPSMRAAMAARFAANPRIKVLAPEDVEKLPHARLDLIVVNSVVQYLTAPEFERLLALWKRLLTPNGALILADVIPPDVGPLSDVAALLRLAAKNGFLLGALAGLARTAVSPYRKLRSALGIAQYTQAELTAKLNAAGFTAKRLPRNLEHNPARMTFRAVPSPSGSHAGARNEVACGENGN